ncbi:Tellurite resistance protein [Leuconostoc suionicum]|uniref:Tellurite resistance protein n=1 Tax=Leuconostoc suionicum TaxID=1511761 RepID=UPI00233EFE3D|nr:Tellurite resistance protein [Leuconostoc suionicum]MDC2806222.1 Tellurite resistance protein [Leuconostoc suionicum]MDC2823734.1 Tellurite resistance protein [Leuconostoc suionicum]
MLIRDMVRTKPISWLLFIFGSDIMMTYGLLLYHGSTRFNPMRDYITILKFVSMDLVSFVFIMLFFDWLHVKFFHNGSENLLDKVLRIGGNTMAAYFGWFAIGFVLLQLFSNFQANQFWLLMFVSGILAIMNWLLRRITPVKFQLNPMGADDN